MLKISLRHILMPILCSLMILPAISQDSIKITMHKKAFSTFSIGINGGVLAPIAPIGGSNDFTKWQPTVGYGGYIKQQFTHYLAIQADFLRGTLKANNDNKLGNGQPTSNPYNSFKTNLNWAASLSGVVTFGNINWLSAKNVVIPYVSLGGGLAGYKPYLTDNSGTNAYKPGGKDIQEFFVPVGAGLKIIATQALNIDLGFRMNYVDGDNLDGYSGGAYHKDKFSYGFAGLEFAFGSKKHPELIADNPVADLKNDLMDKNNALRSQIAASEQQNQSSIATLQTQVDAMKLDADKDGVPDYFDKCPNTPDTVKVDGSGCPLPNLQPPPATIHQTFVITQEDKQTVAEAIKDLQFDFGKSSIRSVSYSSLDRVAQVLINKGFNLKLAGYTDNVGSDAANQKLSQDRAEAVKDYLISKGADASHIQVNGYGESNPVATNKTAAGRAKNRRVEFTLF